MKIRETLHKSTCAAMALANISSNSSHLEISTLSDATSINKGIKKNLDDYEVVNVPNKTSADLGKGSYGSVKLVKEKGTNSNKLFAMKIVIFFFFGKWNFILFE